MRRPWRITLALVLALAAWTGFNTRYAWRDYLLPAPVAFREDNSVRLGLYPRGARSATVFTNDDFSAETPLAEAEAFRDWLAREELPVTFFVIPFQQGRGRLVPGPCLEILRRLESEGHEIAQHGFSHLCPVSAGKGGTDGAEMARIGREEAAELIARGRKILRECGFEPLGHRSPCFSGTEETFYALESLGFLYGSDRHLPARTFSNLFLPGFRGRVMYPYHPAGMKLLEITSQTDPTVSPEKARKVFERFHRRGGAIIYLTHLPQIGRPENLRALGEFLEYVRSHDTWICRLDELTRWWLARERTEVFSRRGEEGLEVVISNPSPFPLEQARLEILQDGPFRIADPAGSELARGMGPEKLTLDIPAQILSRR